MNFAPLLKTTVVDNSRFTILFNTLTKPSENKNGFKIKPKLSKKEFIKLVKSDPTTKLNNVDVDNANLKELSKIKAGKYVQWLIKNYLTPTTERTPEDNGYEKEVEQVKNVFMEDLYKITDDLKKFERFKSKIKGEKDINKLTPKQLYDTVKNFNLALATTTKSERKYDGVHLGSELLFDGDNWRVIGIKDKGTLGKEAACFYGGNNQETRWCTSAPGLTYFEDYIKDGPLYVIFNPNDTNVAPYTGLPKNRYQFHFPFNQFMDREDTPQDLISLLNGPMKELKEFFKPEFAKGLTVGGEKFVIDSLTKGAVGKFITLYGFEDLILDLPNTLQEFQILNRRDKYGVILELPNVINKFKKLQHILLDNCISSVPDSICELPELTFLTLTNNLELKTLPDCLSEVTTLKFLNILGSNNIEIPTWVKEKGVDLGNGMWDLTTD
jgi:hypothetical protein